MNQIERKIDRPLVNSDLLRTFVVIAGTGNLTLAASHLCRTQSAISVQLKRLEQELGVDLFHRAARGMDLTEAGKTLLPKARSILSEIDDVGSLFAAPLTGAIKVGIPDDFDDKVLERILADFARAHPGVDVIATSGCTSGYAQAIQSGDLDIAVCSGPENLGGETLGTERTVWAVAQGANTLNWDMVPVAVLDRSCWWRDLPVKALEAAGRACTIAFRSSSFASLQAAIRSGIAVGVIPASSIGSTTRILTRANGFPDLPASRRSIHINKNAPTELTTAMSHAIRSACVLR